MLLAQSAQRLALPERLFALGELDVLYDCDHRALWTFMRPKGRPSFTPPIRSAAVRACRQPTSSLSDVCHERK